MESGDTQPRVATTAGLRGASWQPSRMAVPFQSQPAGLVTHDGAATQGILYTRSSPQAQPRKVVFIMHPREFVMTHYLVPDVLDAGWACWVQGARSIGSDLRLEHELALLDVAAGMSHLRGLGFEKIVLLGNSGGAGLFAFYNQQSLLEPASRIRRTPGGRPTKLETASMPTADGIAFVSPHPGQGTLLMNMLDPSVTDEADPFSCDPALDPFSAANGYKAPPESSSYSKDFIARYRAAQRERVARIDEYARGLIARRQQARGKLKDGTANEATRRMAGHGPIFNVWRTDADLRCWDTSLDPSDRFVGSLWGADPMTSNWGNVGFGRVVTPESWLSTWSGLSSNASLAKCAGAIEQPTLFVEYTGDNCVFPEEVAALYDAIASSRKTRLRVQGNHHGQPLVPGGEFGQALAGEQLRNWLQATF